MNRRAFDDLKVLTCVAIGVAALAVAMCRPCRAAIPGLRFTDLGTASDAIKNGWVTVSPDARHVAYWGPGAGVRSPTAFFSMAENSARLMINGRPTPPYRAVFTPTFSADGEHFAYFADAGDGLALVVDGRARRDGVDSVDPEVVVSSTGRGVAYYGIVKDESDAGATSRPGSDDGVGRKRDEKEKSKRFVVCNGVKGRVYDGIGTLVFSADGQRLAYAARQGDQWLVVCDGTEGPRYASIGKNSITFSPDGKQLAYTAKRPAGDWVAVIDGKESAPAHTIGRPLFSPDGSIFGFAVFRSEHEGAYILNGKRAGEVYDDIDDAVFSSDGKHYVFTARRDKRWRVVHDGREGTPYADVLHPRISADGAHVAYVARDNDGKHFVVLDGKPVGDQKFDEISALCLSDDGRAVAYCGKLDVGQIVMYSPEQGASEYEEVRHLAMSPDGKHLAYWGRRGGKWLLVIDGNSEPAFDGPLKDSRIVFRGNDAVHALAVNGNTIFRAELDLTDGPSGPPEEPPRRPPRVRR